MADLHSTLNNPSLARKIMAKITDLQNDLVSGGKNKPGITDTETFAGLDEMRTGKVLSFIERQRMTDVYNAAAHSLEPFPEEAA